MNKPKLLLRFIVIAVVGFGVPAIAQFPSQDGLIAQEMRDKGNYDRAIDIYTRLLESSSERDKSELYGLRGECFFLKKEYDRAMEDANSGLEKFANSARALVLRAQVYRKRGEFAPSLVDLDRVVQLDASADHYRLRASVNLEAGNYDDALRDVNKTIEVRRDSSDAVFFRGYIYQKRGEVDQALADYSKAIELNPYDPNIYLQRAWLYRQQRRYEESLADAGKAVELAPRRPDAYISHAATYRALGLYDLALADLVKAQQIEPNAKDLSYNLGHAHLATGKYELAIEDFTRAIAEAPTFVGNYYSRAWAQLDASHGLEAYKDADQFLTKNGPLVDPGSYAVMVGYLGLRKANRAEDAKAFLSKWSGQIPADIWAKSILNFLEGNLTSDQLLSKATDNDKLTEAHAYIGEMAWLSGDKKSAASHLAWVKDRGNKTFSEYYFAIAELGRLPH